MTELVGARVLTLVCTHCHAGWYASGPGHCARCGRPAIVRGVQLEVPLRCICLPVSGSAVKREQEETP